MAPVAGFSDSPTVELYIPPATPLRITFTVPVLQNGFPGQLIVAVGNGKTFTITASELLHPFASIPVTVQVVVVIGFATIEALVVADKY